MLRRAAFMAGLALISGVAVGQNGPMAEQTRLAIRFEPHSSRLAPEQADRFAQLGGILRNSPDAMLVVLLPFGQEAPNARFVAARAAELQRHLQSFGLSAVTRRTSQAVGDEEFLFVAIDAPAALPAPQPEPASSTAPLSSPAPQAPVPAQASSPTMWRAEAGRTLRDLLNDWAEQAGWTVVWQSSFDYPLEASANFSGDFADAVGQLVRGFAEAKPAPSARLHRANQVVIIE